MAALDIEPGPHAIIFDCFGVLYVDNKQSLRNTIAPEHRQELEDVFTANNYGYLDRTTYIEEVAALLGMSVQQTIDYYAHEHTLNIELIDYIRDNLAGRYTLGLLSNIGRGWIDDFFDKHQLHELFDAVVLSGEEGITKPNPAIFTLAAERLNVPSYECIMIDDIEENCGGADIAGMKSIHYSDNRSLFEQLAEYGI